MKNNKSSVLKPALKIFVLIIIIIIMILISFVILHCYNTFKGNKDKLIFNVLEKQELYTQIISKDVNQLQVLMQSAEVDQSNQSEESIWQNISIIKKDLTQARLQYSKILFKIHDDKMDIGMQNSESKYVKKISNLWKNYDKAIQVVVRSEKINPELVQATDYINNNNAELLKLSDELSEQFLDYSIYTDRKIEYIEYGLFGLLIIFAMAFVINMNRLIIQPYDQLIKGITDIGLDHYQVKSKLSTRKKVLPLITEVNVVFQKINYLISLIENINNNNSFMETLTYINKTFSPFIPYNYIGIALISGDNKYIKASYGVSDGTIIGLPERIMGAAWLVEDSSLGGLLSTGEARIINDLEDYCTGKPMKPYNKVLLEAGVKASIALPLKVSGKPVGIIFFSSRNKNVYNEGHLHFLKTLANSIAISFNQSIFTSQITYSSILALAKLSEARDEDTGEHMERMTKYARTIAQLLYENEIYPEEVTIEYIDQIEHFSPLHDIGKVGIMDGILLKPGKLTPEEFNEMKKHANYGAEVLRSADKNMQQRGKSLFGMGIEIAEGHHEKWDGSGYPNGKRGGEIPLSARITAIADVFDALTSKRPYKEAFPFEKSMGIIAEGRGTHFDPVIVDVFMTNSKHIEDVYQKYRQQR